jgi:S1-C subfamily serine protease
MGQFEIPGFLAGQKTNNEQAALAEKLQTDSLPTDRLAPGFERIPTQLPGDRWNPSDITAYRANSGVVAQYKQARESVAYIESQSTAPLPPGAMRAPTTGSGFVATADGRVVTSYHVVKDVAPGSLSVTLPGGRKYQADVEYLDPKTELAVLRLHRQQNELFKPLPMAENSDLRQGDRVAALGYPRGVNEVFMSVGGNWQRPQPFESQNQFAQNKWFIAADGSGFAPGGYQGKTTLAEMLYDKNGRQRIRGGLLPGEDPNRKVIATDLKVEPGNSGGPLLNQEFKAIGVIGMTDVVGSRAGSTPIEDVRAVLAAAKVFERPNLPVYGNKETYNPTLLFPFLRPATVPPGAISNRIEFNPAVSLQYQMKETLPVRR